MELSLGVGLTLIEGVGLGETDPADGFDWAWVSRRRAAIRSTVDCRPTALRSETLGVGFERKGIADSPVPMDGLERLIEGLGWLRLTDGLWLGATALGWLGTRFCGPMLGEADLGTDGLGAGGADGPVGATRFMVGGLEGACGAACMRGDACTLGAWLCPADREAPPLSRPRIWLIACGAVASSRIPAVKPTAERRRPIPPLRGPPARERIFSLRANIKVLLSPRRQYHQRASTPHPANRRHSARPTGSCRMKPSIRYETRL